MSHQHKYEYQKLPIGLCNSLDIFQQKEEDLMADLEFVRPYIDDLIGSWTCHLQN